MENIFDMKTFVNQEIANYEKSTCSIYKEGEVNGESEQKSIPSKDFKWDKELKVLSNMDIRKSSWIDYIIIDTVFNEGNDSSYTVRYQTISPKIPIKRLEVCIDCSNNSTPNKIDMSSQCSLCTCWLEAKSRNLEQSCPIDKWQLIDKEMEL